MKEHEIPGVRRGRHLFARNLPPSLRAGFVQAPPTKDESMRTYRRTKKIVRKRKVAAKRMVPKPQHDGVAGCVWVIELMEELSEAGHIEMARSLGWNLLSLWKGLSRKQTARVQRILTGVAVDSRPTPKDRGER